MPRALWWSQGGGLFLMSEVPLYAERLLEGDRHVPKEGPPHDLHIPGQSADRIPEETRGVDHEKRVEKRRGVRRVRPVHVPHQRLDEVHPLPVRKHNHRVPPRMPQLSHLPLHVVRLEIANLVGTPHFGGVSSRRPETGGAS